MVELKLNISDVDYAAVARVLGGRNVAGSALSLMTGLLPDAAKEELAADLINSNARQLETMLEEAAAKKGIRLSLSGAHASVIDPSEKNDRRWTR